MSTTTSERIDFWAGVSAYLSTLAGKAKDYLPTEPGDPAIEWDDVELLLNAVYGARNAADTATGAYVRAFRAEQPSTPASPATGGGILPGARPDQSTYTRPATRGWS